MDGLYLDKLTSSSFFDNLLAYQRDDPDREGLFRGVTEIRAFR